MRVGFHGLVLLVRQRLPWRRHFDRCVPRSWHAANRSLMHLCVQLLPGRVGWSPSFQGVHPRTASRPSAGSGMESNVAHKGMVADHDPSQPCSQNNLSVRDGRHVPTVWFGRFCCFTVTQLHIHTRLLDPSSPSHLTRAAQLLHAQSLSAISWPHAPGSRRACCEATVGLCFFR